MKIYSIIRADNVYLLSVIRANNVQKLRSLEMLCNIMIYDLIDDAEKNIMASKDRNTNSYKYL